MENIKITVPYPVGTYLDRIEADKIHTDMLYECIVTKDGIFAVLMLDAFQKPRIQSARLSKRISIEKLNDIYTLTQYVHLNISKEDVKATGEIFSEVKRKTM